MNAGKDQTGPRAGDMEFWFVRGQPSAWRGVAAEFKEAADVVMRANQFYTRPYILLLSLALENALIGVAIHRHPEILRRGEVKYNHDLQKAAMDAGLDPNSEQKNLLVRLSHFIRRHGRYPISKTPKQMTGNSFLDVDKRECEALLEWAIAIIDEPWQDRENWKKEAAKWEWPQRGDSALTNEERDEGKNDNR